MTNSVAAALSQFNHGDKVKIIDGEHKDKIGKVVDNLKVVCSEWTCVEFNGFEVSVLTKQVVKIDGDENGALCFLKFTLINCFKITCCSHSPFLIHSYSTTSTSYKYSRKGSNSGSNGIVYICTLPQTEGLDLSSR